jgi:hypothetical protein
MSPSSLPRRTSRRAERKGPRPWCRWSASALVVLVVATDAPLLSRQPAAETGAQELGTPAVPAAWRGAEALLVLVTDERGQGLPDVAVTLRPSNAPEALHGLLTDTEGRLELAGLAAGEWQVDLVREGFMLFTAYLKLSPAKDPEVAFSSRQRTGSYWAPLQAVFVRPGDASAAAASAALRTGRASAQQARRQAAQRAAQEQRAAERLERRMERGSAARVVEEPARHEPERASSRVAEEAAPAPAAAPTLPAAAPTAAAPTTVVEAEPAAVEPARPLAEGPAERPAEKPAVVDRERLDIETRAPVPGPVLLPNPTLRQAGACVECQPGEWSMTSAGRAAVAGPCLHDPDRLVEAAKLVASGLPEALRSFAGPLVAEDANDVLRLLPAELATRVRTSLGDLASPGSSCVVLGLVLPAGSRYVGFRYQAGERATMGECPIGGACQIGDASWPGPPVLTSDTGTGLTVVHALFENRSSRRERLPQLTVYFRPPAGWLPPSGAR